MTKSAYIIGGAGTGKSTFTQTVLDISNRSMGPLEDLYSKPNSRGTMITLRGHQVGIDGMYLGCMRESFPGTDGLDRVSYIPGEEWLATALLPDWILGEGATLAVRRFLYALDVTTDMLLVWLVTDEKVKEARFAERGSSQDPKFVAATATRSENLAHEMSKAGAHIWTIDTDSMDEWEQGLEIVSEHLGF